MGGAKEGPNSQQAHDVVTTSMRRNDVASTSFRRRVPTRFLINQCQIITFLILKYDIIENSRIELRGIILHVQVGGLLGGGQRVCWPPPPSLKLLGGLTPPPRPPSSYAYGASISLNVLKLCSKTANMKIARYVPIPDMIKGVWVHLNNFLLSLQKETTFVTSCLLFWTM